MNFDIETNPRGCATNSRSRIAVWKQVGRVALIAALIGGVACAGADPLDEVRSLQAAGDYQATIEPLRELVTERPDDPEVLFLYGRALVMTGGGALAVWSLRKSMASTEWRAQSGLLLAEMMVHTKDWRGAIDITNELLEIEPDNQAALRLRAKARVGSRRDYEGSLADSERLLELDPDDVDGLINRTISLLALDRIDEAETALETLSDHYQDDSLDLTGSPRLCAALATFAKEKGETELAADRFDRCLESFPGEVLVLNEALGFFDQQGRPERSIEALEAAVESVPTASNLRTILAHRLRASGREEEALELMRAATELPPPANPAGAWLDIAGFLVEGGRFDEGLEAYDEALALMPEPSDPVRFRYADALVLAQRYDQALVVAGKMESVAFREFVQGRVDLERHDPAPALEHFERGLRLWPDNAVVRYYAALAAEQVGDFDRAIEHYRYSIRSDATASDSMLRLARLYVALGRPDEALTAMATSQPGADELIETGLLQLEILARMGRNRAPKPLVEFFAQPELWAHAAVARARGAYERTGAKGAIAAVRDSGRLDLSEPRNVVALTWVAEWLIESGKADEGRRLVESAVEAHPEVAGFQALHGRVLAATGADPSPVRAAYEQALAINGAQPVALRGLAALDAEQGRTDQAISLYERAVEAEPDDPRAHVELAALLSANAQREAAEQVLEALLRNRPFEAEAAFALARLRLERGADDARTRELARRAVRFGGGADARALVEQLGEHVEVATPERGAEDAVVRSGPET